MAEPDSPDAIETASQLIDAKLAIDIAEGATPDAAAFVALIRAAVALNTAR